MDFFGHQEQARRNTLWLILLFTAAVVVIVLAVYGAVTVGLYFGQYFQAGQQLFSLETFWNPVRFLWTVLITLAVILAGSMFKSSQLRQGGGAGVAEMLGGERVPAATEEPLLRRLLNIVEEMAIASGLPVPPVYLLQQSGINAFAAGFTPSDAVIAVTRGAVELLGRDELQGVVAHEFSHILNGDTRMKMRLLGLLFGITLISDAGITLLTARRTVRYSRQERGTHPGVLVLGLLLFAVGTVGAVFADLIKRAVSRQREYLADAAAVQFTRNPAGLAGALKVIGGYQAGSRVQHAAASQASHFFFCNALKRGGGGGWWATHPPLLARIRRLEPGFTGMLEPVDPVGRSQRVMDEAYAAVAPIDGEEAPPPAAERMLETVGNPGHASLAAAQRLVERIPERLRNFAHDPYTARAIVHALLISSDSRLRSRQLALIEQGTEANVFRELLDIQPQVERLEPVLRLPLLELTLPALKGLSPQQYQAFHANIMLLIKADLQVSLFEYMLQRMLLRHLRPAFKPVAASPVRFRRIDLLADDCSLLLAALIRFGSHAAPAALHAEVLAQLGLAARPMPDAEAGSLKAIDQALRRLAQATPAIKQALLSACAHCVLADGRLAVGEAELMRSIADALDCPMPPITAAQSA